MLNELSAAAAASLLGLSIEQLEAHKVAGRIRAIDESDRWVYPVDEVMAFLRSAAKVEK